LINSMNKVIFLVVALALIFPAQGKEWLSLTNLEGVEIEARIIQVKGDRVQLMGRNGATYLISVSVLSPESRKLVLHQTERSESPPSSDAVIPGQSVQSAFGFDQMNQTLGQSLFKDGLLWDDDPKKVGKRLGWPIESSTENSVSFRYYASSSYSLLGARPYSAALYGSSEKASGLSVVFANKGDCFASAGTAEAHFKEGSVTKDPKVLQQWIERDEESIKETLEKALGKPRRQNYGQGSSKRKVSRWDWSGHSFLLSIAEGEFVSLAIEPVEVADSRGKPKKVSDMHIRRVHRSNVDNRANGDTVIRNIPMVDQGPKGYCVPATFERCMRYMEIPADMYLLAMAGSTGLGGGTHTPTLVKSVQQEVWAAGRTFDALPGHPGFREIQRSIDSGVPILWGMHSTEVFNRIANNRTTQRKSINPKDWKKTVEDESESVLKSRKPHISDSRHICIIHGYNKETEEIAFTDSWGERYRERWISAAEAEHFSQGRCWVIQY
jgi:hypothetical protein